MRTVLYRSDEYGNEIQIQDNSTKIKSRQNYISIVRRAEKLWNQPDY